MLRRKLFRDLGNVVPFSAFVGFLVFGREGGMMMDRISSIGALLRMHGGRE